MQVLITGGAGFIGSHLTDVLIARDYSVTCVDDLSKGPFANIRHLADHPRYTFERMDIRDLDRLQEVGRGADVVVHLAASKIPRYSSALANVEVNIEGCRCAINVAKANDAKFVLASTSDVYGKNPKLPFREDSDLVVGPSTSRRWAYAVTKLCDEHMAYAYRDEYDLRVAILRFFGCYGERQYLNWWGGPQGVFLRALDTGEPMEVHGGGRQTRCFVHIDDLAEATARAVERPEADGEILNIGTDEEVDILTLARLMHETGGFSGEPRINLVPYESLGGNYEDVERRVPDLEKMTRVLGFRGEITLRDGLTRLWAWYRSLDPEVRRQNALEEPAQAG